MSLDLLLVVPAAVLAFWCIATAVAPRSRRTATVRPVHRATLGAGDDRPGLGILVPDAEAVVEGPRMIAADLDGGALTIELLGPVERPCDATQPPGGLPAAEDRARSSARDPWGEPDDLAPATVEQIVTAAGQMWRRTVETALATTVTDLHVDHAGWAFVVRLVGGPDHAHLLAAAEGVLASWRWLDPVPARRPAG